MDFYLGHENINRATINKCKCGKCDVYYDIFEIIGDSWAMNFMGVIGLTNLKDKEIFITYLTKYEFLNHNDIQPEVIEMRVKQFIDRDSLRYFKNYNDYEKYNYKKCLECGNKLEVIRKSSLEEYMNSGGKIYCVNLYESVN